MKQIPKNIDQTLISQGFLPYAVRLSIFHPCPSPLRLPVGPPDVRHQDPAAALQGLVDALGHGFRGLTLLGDVVLWHPKRSKVWRKNMPNMG